MAGVIFGRGGSNQSAAYQPVLRVLSPAFTNQAYPPRNGNIQGWNQPDPPSVSAAFSVDFTSTSSLPSQMSLSRASNGTYFNSSGVLSTATSNVARFDYDPWSLSPLGPLIEEQRTNYSQTGDLSAWSWAGTLYTVTAVAGLDGTNNAYNIVPSTATSSRTMDIHAVTVPATTSNVIYSVYAKANGYGELIFREQAGQGNPGVSFNLFTGKIVGYENGWAPPAAPPNTWFTDARIIPVGGGWYRCSVVCRYSSGTNTRWMGLVIGNGTWVPSNVSDPGPNYVFAGNGTSGVIVAYPQSEIATSASQVNPTSYIYTSGSAVTRSADIVSSTDATWLGYKGWVIETGDMQPDTDATLLGINTAIGLGYSSADVLTTADGGTQSTSLTLDPNYVHRGAMGWDSAPRVAISLDGSAVTTAANTPVTPTTLYFGNTNNGASGFLNGHIRMIGGYTTLSNSDLPAVSVQGATFTGVVGAANITYAATLGALTQALTGTVIDSAVVNQTLGPLGQTATGTVSNAAVVAQTLGALTQIATDTVLAQATTTQTLGVLGQATTATNLDHAVVAQTLGALSQVASGTVIDAITVAQNLGALTQSAAATHPDTAAVAQTLGALVQTATGGVVDTATAAQTLGALAQAATASAPAALTTSQTLGALGQTTTGNAIVAAVASQTLGALAQAASGTVTDAATVAQTLGALAQTATGGVVDNAAVAQTLGALTQAATATVADPRSITATQTLGALAQALTGTVVDTATVAQALGPLGQSVSLTHTDTATTAQTLGAIVQALTGVVIDTGTVTQALGALNQTATASTTSGFIAAQTLGGLVQALTGTVVSHATVAQALGGLQQTTTGGPVARIGAYTDTLPPLGQTATAGIPRIVTVSQALGAIAQTASLSVPQANFAASQILGSLGQIATSTAANRALAIQALGALGQGAGLRITPVAAMAIHGSAVKVGRGMGSLGQRAFLAGSATSRPILLGKSKARTILSGSTR
jgi:hypothetical protein